MKIARYSQRITISMFSQQFLMSSRLLFLPTAAIAVLIAIAAPEFAQFVPPAQISVSQTDRPTPPTRDPNSPAYVRAKELPDGSIPPANVDGNFIIGPTHNAAPELSVHGDLASGTVIEFTMSSPDSKIYPGIARDAGTFGTSAPSDPTKLIVTTSHPAPYTRTVAVYVPNQYEQGSVAPFMVGADGPDRLLFAALDALIAQHKLPTMIAISIENGGGDAQGSERGLEYDTMSGAYAEFVENEVLPLVENRAHVKLTKDPDGRATIGRQLGRFVRLDYGVVPPRAVSSGAHLLGNFYKPAMALQSANAARRLGISRAPHPK